VKTSRHRHADSHRDTAEADVAESRAKGDRYRRLSVALQRRQHPRRTFLRELEERERCDK
jgi:hypothetical protein